MRSLTTEPTPYEDRERVDRLPHELPDRVLPVGFLADLLTLSRRLELHRNPLTDLLGHADAAIVLASSQLIGRVLAQHESRIGDAHALHLADAETEVRS